MTKKTVLKIFVDSVVVSFAWLEAPASMLVKKKKQEKPSMFNRFTKFLSFSLFLHLGRRHWQGPFLSAYPLGSTGV